MANVGDYQLPAGIQMPERFIPRLSSQIWFYSGVQAGLEGLASSNEGALARSTGTQVAAAYQAGLAMGRAKRAELEDPAHQILVPEKHSRTIQEKIWFMKGVDDGLTGQAFEQPANLAQKRGAELLQAYRTGYQAGKNTLR
jgi:hypothetical protein